MQRKRIKVGEAYAITNARGKRTDSAGKVKGTVVALDAEYEKRRSGFSSLTYPANDGIRIRFDEPVVFGYADIETLAAIKERYTAVAYKEAEGRSVAEFVTGEARFIYEKWDTYEARQRAHQDARQRWNREADEKAVTFKPILDATIERLRAMGYDPKLHTDMSGITFAHGGVSLNTSFGTDEQKKIVGFGYTSRVNTEFLTKLLGVEYRDGDEDDDDADEGQE